MPYIALSSNNEEVTASHCRDEYLRTGVILSGFKCAFCLCAYHSRYIYVDGKIGRAPHFFATRTDPHKGACDGTPLGVVAEPVSGKQGKRIPDQDFRFPEKFVAKQKPRLVAGTNGSVGAALSDEEIRSRRNRAGKEYGASTFTSSVLEVIVESKNKISSWCFNEGKKLNLDKAALSKLLKEMASSYPLQLFEQKGLDYESAFWSGHYARDRADKRIFHAKGGTAVVSLPGFVICSEPKVPSQGQSLAKKPGPRSVEVHYHGENYDGGTPPQAHTRALSELASLAVDETIQWYAYGEMTLEGDKLVVRLETLDHLYFRREKKFNPRKAS
jgi:hypothetical protein